MTSVAVRCGRAFLVLSTACFFFTASCGDDKKKDVAPGLTQLLAIGPGGTAVDLVAQIPDGGHAVGAISPVSSFKAVFDDLLDTTKIQPIGDSGTPMGNAAAATVTWAGAITGAPSITTSVTYDPAGYSQGLKSAAAISVSVQPGLPSGSTLSLKLDSTLITSKGGKPYVSPTGSETFSFTTEPFTATTSLAASTLAPDAMVAVSFNNVVGAGIASRISVTSEGASVPVTVTENAETHAFDVAPTAGSWTVGKSYTITISKDAADQFGVKMPADVTATFTAAVPAADGGTTESDAGADVSTGADAGADVSTEADASVADTVVIPDVELDVSLPDTGLDI